MTCEHAIEHLPWLLNGSLAAGERDEVWHHLETCESCRRALAETREAWSVFAQHLPSQNLVALAWGEAPSEAVQEHLATCPQCAAELELARISRRLEEEGNVALFPAARLQRETGRAYRGWRAAAIAASLAGLIAAGGWFQARRQPMQVAAVPSAKAPAVVQPQTKPAPGEAAGEIAALQQKVKDLSVYVDGLEGQVRQAQEQVAQRAEPSGLTASPWLSGVVSPTDVVRGEAGNEEIVSVPAKASLAVLPLRAMRPETGVHDGHEIVILSESGKPVATKRAQWDPNGWYLLALTRGELKPGAYTLQVYGTAGGKRDPEADGTYKIRVQ
jgi:hypothetical protein